MIERKGERRLDLGDGPIDQPRPYEPMPRVRRAETLARFKPLSYSKLPLLDDLSRLLDRYVRTVVKNDRSDPHAQARQQDYEKAFEILAADLTHLVKLRGVSPGIVQTAGPNRWRTRIDNGVYSDWDFPAGPKPIEERPSVADGLWREVCCNGTISSVSPFRSALENCLVRHFVWVDDTPISNSKEVPEGMRGRFIVQFLEDTAEVYDFWVEGGGYGR